MKQTTSIRPAYSQVVICDPTAKVDVPLWERGVGFVASHTCILFGCYPEPDGPTDLAFGTGEEVGGDGPPTCEFTLHTPGRRIAVETVEGASSTCLRKGPKRSFASGRIAIGCPTR